MMRCLPAFRNGPDDQGLAPALVTRGEDARHIGFIVASRGLDIGSRIGCQAQLFCDRRLAPGKPEGQQGQLAGPFPFASGDFLQNRTPVGCLFPGYLYRNQATEVSFRTAFPNNAPSFCVKSVRS